MRLLTAISVLTLLLSCLLFGDKPPDTPSLAGLKAVDVLIEELTPDTKSMGLSEGLLKTVVELRLRQAGVALLEDLPEPDYKNMPNPQDKEAWGRFLNSAVQLLNARQQHAKLYLNLHCLKIRETSLYVYHVQLEVDQEARLDRNNEIWLPLATTWYRGTLGFASRDQISEAIRGDVSDLVDDFINQYLSANPVR
jgi:hypothetical protein